MRYSYQHFMLALTCAQEAWDRYIAASYRYRHDPASVVTWYWMGRALTLHRYAESQR